MRVGPGSIMKNDVKRDNDTCRVIAHGQIVSPDINTPVRQTVDGCRSQHEIRGAVGVNLTARTGVARFGWRIVAAGRQKSEYKKKTTENCGNAQIEKLSSHQGTSLKPLYIQCGVEICVVGCSLAD